MMKLLFGFGGKKLQCDAFGFGHPLARTAPANRRNQRAKGSHHIVAQFGFVPSLQLSEVPTQNAIAFNRNLGGQTIGTGPHRRFNDRGNGRTGIRRKFSLKSRQVDTKPEGFATRIDHTIGHAHCAGEA